MKTYYHIKTGGKYYLITSHSTQQRLKTGEVWEDCCTYTQSWLVAFIASIALKVMDATLFTRPTAEFTRRYELLKWRKHREEIEKESSN